MSGQGAFERAHDWTGDALTAPESAAFQEGKAKALKKLLPYAHPSSNQEAAAVVLELDGSEFGFWVGSKFSVESYLPENRLCAHLHTHSSDEPPSAVDWANFLTIGSVMQAHVICPTKTYSLHKSAGWVAPPDLDSQRNIKNAWADANTALDQELRQQKRPVGDLEFDEMATQKMASRCGILFRIGSR